ncbi:uncharacterized protein METZ01_LOCUS90211 [marine metagenome]|uniref:Uncharacterized protein n=1 Tax=marine metagenome TaxID=408172 RepID=A0A381VCK8_9ZZZZ
MKPINRCFIFADDSKGAGKSVPVTKAIISIQFKISIFSPNHNYKPYK